jgi:uncharacterized protein (DUF2237 family)
LRQKLGRRRNRSAEDLPRARGRAPNALADNLRASLEKGPVKFRLLVQVAAADDSITDARKVWPDSRPTV